ncbi:MAG: M48 family metallopeptidase [Omnitrophica WOR_2 bacterium]
MENMLFSLIIFLFIANFIINETLKYFNNRWRHKPIPEELKDVYSSEKYITYLEYKKETYRFSVISSIFSFLLTFIMLLAGFALLDEWIRGFISNEIFVSIVFFAVIGLASDILSTPFDVYETFVIEQKYGFNTTTVKTYILDKLKSYLIALVVGFPILYLVIWLYFKFGTDFWWMVWILVSVLSFLISMLYSNIIVPLFNKQTPLEEGDLRNRIQELASVTGFKLEKVFVINGSKRSTRANAYFTGFGSKKRIVLYDTLINTQPVDQIISILAHELGHFKKKHTIKGLITSIIQTGLLLFLFSLIIDNQAIYSALGTVPGFHIGMIIFVILYSPVSFVLSLVTNYISRKHEFQADNYAVLKSSGSSLITALKQLTANNMSDLNPNPWYVKAYYSHPPLKQRIEAINKVL